MQSRVVHLKVKIKSLAAESRIIRAEERKAGPVLRRTLDIHRRGVVRSEARITQLAYGFLRGRRYRQMERTAASPPDWQRVRQHVERFGACWDSGASRPSEDLKQRQLKQAELWESWLLEAATDVPEAA